jgi:hypothetical protein
LSLTRRRESRHLRRTRLFTKHRRSRPNDLLGGVMKTRNCVYFGIS